jgi:hypothetical protein
MASSHDANTDTPRRARGRAASIAARLAFAAMALGIGIAVAHADNADGTPRQPDSNAQRAAQNPAPARVILPAPWEQAPARPAVAPAEPADRK